jgi:DNA-binding NarL/FixJ family response regulator
MARPWLLLAQNDAAAAAELRRLLETEFEVVVTVGDGRSLVAAADVVRPDVIVTDVVMPGQDGIDATIELRQRHPDIRVVLVTVHDDPRLVERGRAAGVLGHVLKLAADTELVPAVRAALRNEPYVSSRPTERSTGRGGLG